MFAGTDGRDVADSSVLAGVIRATLDGRFPRADGGWSRVRPWRPGLEAVVAFTGHAVLAVEGPLPALPPAPTRPGSAGRTTRG